MKYLNLFAAVVILIVACISAFVTGSPISVTNILLALILLRLERDDKIK